MLIVTSQTFRSIKGSGEIRGQFLGPRVAGPVLFLPARPIASLDRAALCRVEPGAPRHGGGRREVALVQRRDPLWRPRSRGAVDNGSLASPLDGNSVAGISRRRIYPYRTTIAADRCETGWPSPNGAY